MTWRVDLPRMEELLLSTEALLSTYEPSALTYLDSKGSWQRNPATLAGRISCELWFRIWESKNAGLLGPLAESLYLPLLAGARVWAAVRAAAERAYGATTVEEPVQAHEKLLAAVRILYLLVECDAYESISTSYVAEWDRKGRATRAQYSDKLTRLVQELAGPTCEAAALGHLASVRSALKADPDSVYSVVTAIISEEELVRSELEGLLAELRVAGDKDEICELVSARVCPHPSVVRKEPRALLRPCIELLCNNDLDVSSGIHYGASAFLGRLSDIRSSESLLRALKDSSPAHTFLRTNLIFALGNLREARAVPVLKEILDGPDHACLPAKDGRPAYRQPLDSEKREAVWALGKIGAGAVSSVPSLSKCLTSPDVETRIYLAWAMGMIGSAQKDKSGGLDATIPITLINLLTGKDGPVFEEATFGLRRLGLPDFLHALYLHDFKTVPILSLKPSSTGLYELSETLLHLASVKRPVVMAVTGDSGTGKTYFCNTIARGFGGIEGHEILYLMRDGPESGIFDRMLGLKWLKAHNEARFYESYPVSEDEDDPDKFFEDFLRRNAGKKLIILDGWRDEDYFHQVVRKFYEKGRLDVLVRFQTAFSTRRINLEEREGTLERVRMHLPLIETPAMEETRFYQEGEVLIYHLDNSIPSRLSDSEIREVFDRQKVDTWGDQIRIGRFSRHTRPLKLGREKLAAASEQIAFATEPAACGEPLSFSPAEETFLRVLNEDPASDPNLLQTVRLRKSEVERIAFYNHGQLAFCGPGGSVGILTGFNDRVYETRAHEAGAVGLAVVGGELCSVDASGRISVTSFSRNTVTPFALCGSPALVVASLDKHSFVTGHADGAVRLWSLSSDNVTVLRGHGAAVCALVADRRGRVFSGSEDGQLRAWHLDTGTVSVLWVGGAPVRALDVYVDGRVVACSDRVVSVTGSGTRGSPGVGSSVGVVGGAAFGIRVVDTGTGDCESVEAGAERTPAGGTTAEVTPRTVNVYFDGRIVAGLGREGAGPGEHAAGMPGSDASRLPDRGGSGPAGLGTPGGSLLVIDPRPDFLSYNVLNGHDVETRDCVTMGPRVVTCGSERSGERTLRIWGTAAYVAKELGKLRLMRATSGRPPYYRSLF